MDREPLKQNPFAGYFASVVLALFVSNGLGAQAVTLLSGFFRVGDPEAWQGGITAGLFFGLSLANPVGTIQARGSGLRAVGRFMAGVLAGAGLHAGVLLPLAGDEGLAGYLLLLLALVLGPLALLAGLLRAAMARRGISLSRGVANATLRVLNLPDRLLFILLMGTSFTIFWQFANDMGRLLLGIGLVLAAMTASVAIRIARDEARRREGAFHEWLELEPLDPAEETPQVRALKGLRALALSFLPGAVLFGAMTRVAVEILLTIRPGIPAGMNDPAEALRTVGIVAASGLGLVFFGMLAALGFCLGLLMVLGRLRGWPQRFRRESALRLIRLMYFRPMKRA